MNVPNTVKPYATGIDMRHHSLEELFPEVNPEFKAYGSRVLIQIRRVISKTASGLILVQETSDQEAWNMQTGKVIGMGPLAFKNRQTNQAWPEGLWCKEGDFVRFPRWGGDRITIPMTDGGQPVVVLILNDHNLLGEYTGDPRFVRTFLE